MSSATAYPDLRPDQRNALEAPGSVFLRAGAGAGKTTTLTLAWLAETLSIFRTLEAREEDAAAAQAMGRVLAVTFTEKAAVEMRLRIRRWLQDGERGQIDNLTALGGRAPLSPAEAAALLAEFPRAQITTIHAFSRKLLAEYALEAGVMPEPELLSETQQPVLRREAVRRVLRRAVEEGDEPVLRLMREQEHFRTTTFASRIEGLVADWQNILVDPVALREEWQRHLAQAAEEFPPLRDRLLGTARELQAHIAETGKSNDTLAPFIAHGAEWLRQIGEWRPGLPVPLEALQGVAGLSRSGPRELTRAMKAQTGELMQPLGRLAAAEAGPVLIELLERVDAELRRRKERDGVLEFGDLIRLAWRLVRDNAAVRESIRRRFEAILVDEFQDTDPVQFDLIERIVHADAEQPLRRFLVGDDRQSIYGFRGADTNRFGEAAERLRAGGGTTCELVENWRSQEPILEVVNGLFRRQGLFGAPETGVRQELVCGPARIAEESGQPAPEGNDPAVEWLQEVLAMPDAEDDPRAEVDDKPLKMAELRVLEGRRLARRILQLKRGMGEGYRPLIRRREGLSEEIDWGDIAILTRTRRAWPDYERALRAAGIPYTLVGGRGFWKSLEVGDVLHALQLLAEPENAIARLAVWRSPLVGLSDPTIAQWLRDGQPSEWEPEETDDRERFGWFREWWAALEGEAPTLRTSTIIETILSRSGYLAILQRTFQGNQRVANVQRLIEQARRLGMRGMGWREFCRHGLYLNQAGEADEAQAALHEEDPENLRAVRLMTVHQAKGLEMPVVILADTSSGEPAEKRRFWIDRDRGLVLRIPYDKVGLEDGWVWMPDNPHREDFEDLRILYVAMTRARDYLIFSGASKISSGSWMAHFQDYLAQESGRVRVYPLAADALPEALEEDGEERAQPDIEAAIKRLHWRPEVTGGIEIATTAAAQTVFCPRFGALSREGVKPGEQPPDVEETEAPTGEREQQIEAAVMAGRLAHAALERIESMPADPAATVLAQVAALREQPAWRELGEADIARVEQDLVRLVQTRGAALWPAGMEAQNEYPFAINWGDATTPVIVRGVFDGLRVDAAGERASVIEYKYARPHSAAQTRVYRLQLGLYLHAVQKLWGIGDPRGLLVWIPQAKVEEVTIGDLPPLKELLVAMLELESDEAPTEEPPRERGYCQTWACPYQIDCWGFGDGDASSSSENSSSSTSG